MSLVGRSVLFGAFAFGLWFFATLLVNPGFFDRLYVVAYNNFSRYCDFCGDYGHGLRFCPSKAVKEGAVGRWVIPSVGVNVACYEAAADAQDVTDAKDSAAFIKKPNITLLADHNYQGFGVIKKCKVGTVAYMDTGVNKQQFVCTRVFVGYNIGSELTDLEGNVVEFDSGYTNYTCRRFSDRITIVHFEPVLR